ncbi:MAG: quinolinate synthase NadA [Anaerolineae bacterium]|nr:quinolinate synthase NadA [Anaerolineae bacterium]
METNELVERIMTLKEEKQVRIIAHSYASHEIHPVADILSDSKGFFEEIMKLADNKDLMVVAPSFFGEIARALLHNRPLTVYAPIIAECPVANHKNLGFDPISDFKKAHPGIPLVVYGASSLEAKALADYIAFPGEVAAAVNSVDAPEVLFVGEGNCGQHALRKSNKKVILYPKNPVCNVYNSINLSDVARARRENPDACLMVHAECKVDVAEMADYAVGTGQMTSLIAELDFQTYILGTEIGFYHRMSTKYPDKKFVHLSDRLVCNAFKSIRLENVLESLQDGKEVIQIDNSIGRQLYEFMHRMS